MNKSIEVDGAIMNSDPNVTRAQLGDCSILSAEIKPIGIDGGYFLDVRVFDVGQPSARLRAAFSSQVASVTLRRDIPTFEALVNSVTEALAADGLAEHGPKLNDLWSRERARLEARWNKIEATGVSSNEVVLGTTYNSAGPALVYRSTAMSRRQSRFDKDDIWGVCLEANGKPKLIGSHSRMTFQPLTQESLAPISFLSGHEKLELLAGTGRGELNRLRLIFDERRLFSRDPIRAVDLDGVIVARNSEISFSNGRHGSFHARMEQKVAKLSIRLEDAKAGIWLDTSRTGIIQIGRNVTNAKRFKSKDTLDEWVRPLVEMIIAYDAELSDEFLAALKAEPFNAEHPMLCGLIVPPRHQPLIGAILGKPYHSAARAAERFEARTAKKAEKADAAKSLAKEIADGAIFGRINEIKSAGIGKFYLDERFEGTKLWFVRTRPATSTRRNREMASPKGTKPRPLTPNQMSRLPLLNKPDALESLSDAIVGEDQRDFIEAAYRLSFHLPGEGRNPILESSPTITLSKINETSWSLRTTAVNSNDITLLAVTVCLPKRDVYEQHHLTGAGFGAINYAGQAICWAHPSLDENGLKAPLDQKDALLMALRKLGTNNHLSAFEAEWSKLEKKYG